MNHRRWEQPIAFLFGVLLSTGVLAEAAKGHAADQPDRSTGGVERYVNSAGAGSFDDRVLTAESKHLLKVGDRWRYSDRGRRSYRGKGGGHRHYDSYRHPGRYRHGRPRHYGYGWSHHHHRDYYDGDRLIWYGLGVLTPYLLDDRFYY